MQSSTTPTIRRLALNQAILFGAIVGVLLTIYLLANYIIYNALLTLILGIVTFLIELGLYAVAGYRASMKTSKTGVGALAGLFTGLIGGLIGAVVSIILLFAYVDITHVRVQSFLKVAERPQYTNSYIISTGLTAAAAGLILAVAYGAGMGAIGGFIAKRRQAQPEQEISYQETPQEDVV